jgi:hypothetical protein
MRTETGTFELRDNDRAMRELTYAETNEVAGGFVAISAVNQNVAFTGPVGAASLFIAPAAHGPNPTQATLLEAATATGTSSVIASGTKLLEAINP